MNSHRRKPYQNTKASRSSAIIFGVGLAAMLCTVAIIAAVAIPGISRRLENLPFYAQTYARKLIPHPEYLPTPAPTVSLAGLAAPNPQVPVMLNLPAIEPTALPTPAHTRSGDAIPVAVSVPVSDEAASDTPKISAAPKIELAPTQPMVHLRGFAHQWQTWNNCGPATVTMNMSFFGRPETQVEAAQFLKPNKNDKNVSPHELAAYARTTGLQALVREGGSIEQLKQFASNNLPVLVETWLVHDGDGLGHYRLITGYDDTDQQFSTFDSLSGANVPVNFDQFDADWRVFNRLYLVIYPPEQANLVATIVGADMDDTAMYSRLVAEAQAEIEKNPDDAIAYFNQGDALTRLQQFDAATAAFDQARTLGLHWRRLWYQFTPFEAYYAAGRYQDVLDLTEATISGTGGLEEAYYYQGLALHATGQTGAAEAFQAALAYNPNFASAKDALAALANQQ